MVKYPLTVKIAGPAGMGIKSSGLLLSHILMAHGFNVRDYSEYPSLVRGGHNTYQVSFSPHQLYSVCQTVDLFFSLSLDHHLPHKPEFHPKTMIFTPQNLPLIKLSQQLGNPQVKNTIALGVAAFLLGLKPAVCRRLIKKQYPQYAVINLKAFDLGLNFAAVNFSPQKLNLKLPSPQKNRHLYDGNQTFALGFIKAKGDFYAAYPMTPSSGALHTLAALAPKHNIKVVHPEDEIAVASLAAGSAFAGARAAVGTSGGGYALMNETVSFCGVAELGVVFYLVSRPGPATGLPTWTSQSDLLYAVHSGHGTFPKIVLAPAHQQDSFVLAATALNLAARLQAPIILLSDKFIAESSASFTLSQLKTYQEKFVTQPAKDFKRYSWASKSGISPRPLPGTPGAEFIANSYEHDQFSFSTESSDIAVHMRQKRQSKLSAALKYTPKPFFLAQGFSTLILSWGSTFGPIRQALAGNSTFSHLHLRTLRPLDPQLPIIISKFKKIIVVENNQTGQLTTLLKSQFNFNPHRQLLKFDGRPFFPEELIKKFKI